MTKEQLKEWYSTRHRSLTVTVLAHRLGYTRSWISQVFKGKREASKKFIDRFEKFIKDEKELKNYSQNYDRTNLKRRSS